MDQIQREREHFFRAAKLVAGMTLLSRILGMVRGMAIAWLGASRATDAFQMAFVIPNLFRRLFGEGALSGAFVPVFTETAEQQGQDHAKSLFANALGLLAVVLAAVMVLVAAGVLTWSALWPGGGWDRRLLSSLIVIMLPYMVLVCLLALASAALNCRGHFAYPAAAPMILNCFVIAAVLVVAPMVAKELTGQLYVVGASVTCAGVAQLAGVLWLLRRRGLPVRPRLLPIQPGTKAMAGLMAPMLLGLGFLQLTSLFDYLVGWVFAATENVRTVSFFGQEIQRPLREGVLVRLTNANTLYQFPMGVLAISLGVAVFPLLSRYAARGDMSNLRQTLNRALRLSMMEGLATGVGLFVLAEPIVAMLFQHGRFTADDTAGTARILRFYALGLWAFCSYPIFTRAFYSLKKPKTPLKVSCVLAVVYMAMVGSLIWVERIGASAFAIAATTTFSFNVLTLAAMLRRTVGRFGGRELLRSVLRTGACCGAMGASVHLLRWQLAGAADWLVVSVCVPAGAAVFVLAARLLRAPELGELIGAVRAGKRRSEQPSEKQPVEV